MADRVVPMIHVPDVRATVDWYVDLGFTIKDTYDDGGDGLSFAVMSFGASEVMFNSDGNTSNARRREVDLYIYSESVDSLYEKLHARVDVIEGPHDTFYGMREFILRDLNGFWVTFGESSVFGKLMTAVYEGETSTVQRVLDAAPIRSDILSAALAAASRAGDSRAEIRSMLLQAGAVMPLMVQVDLLQSYTGKYKGGHGFEINVTEKDGVLYAAPGNQQPMSLIALSEQSFRPTYFDNYGTLNFIVEKGKTSGCTVDHGGEVTRLQRVDDVN
jgi:uncharacterized glyoxalase superfamily protein PhnB